MNPFEIPNELLKEWRKIGDVKASKKAKKHELKYKKIFFQILKI